MNCPHDAWRWDAALGSYVCSACSLKHADLTTPATSAMYIEGPSSTSASADAAAYLAATPSDRQAALELAWKLRELAHALATCKHAVADEVEHKTGRRPLTCAMCGASRSWDDGAKWYPHELARIAKTLDGEMNSGATTLHEPEGDSEQKKRH
jgi:hypothetical protein